MNCYLIDREAHAIQMLVEYISHLENFKVVGSIWMQKKYY
jgi:hypothetical protein